MSDHEKYNDNVDSATKMVEEAESNPSKRVQFLPVFINVLSTKQLEFFKYKE